MLYNGGIAVAIVVKKVGPSIIIARTASTRPSILYPPPWAICHPAITSTIRANIKVNVECARSVNHKTTVSNALEVSAVPLFIVPASAITTRGTATAQATLFRFLKIDLLSKVAKIWLDHLLTRTLGEL